jgi:serine protease Do
VAGIREPITPKGQETIETWGITVDDISSEVREQIGLEEDHGLIITEVKSQSPAEKAGILAGDVILEVNYNKINNADDLVKYLGESNKDKGALFYLYRQGEYGFRLVKPAE